MKYRKKPIIVEAIRWMGWEEGPEIEGLERIDAQSAGTSVEVMKLGYLKANSSIVRPGDWIITDINGIPYPCTDEIFQQTFEPVE